MLGRAQPEPPTKGPVHGEQGREANNFITETLPAPLLYLIWFGFIALHTLCFAYFAITAWCYWNLPGTVLDAWLDYFNIGWGTDHDKLVATVHGFIAVIHAGYMWWMIGWSLKKQRLIFAVYNVFARPSTRLQNGTGRITKIFATAYKAFLSKRELISVSGPYFDLVLLSREILETGLQTQQAYRMSRFLPRAQLNRGYIALLVLNCWSTTLVHIIFHKNSQRRRIYVIIIDCVLDVVTSVGITSTLMIVYFPDFDFTISGFPLNKWFEDIWAMHAFGEFQILLVTSSGDLVMRMIFALSLLSNMSNMKKILSMKTTRHKSHTTHGVTAVLPCHPSLSDIKVPPKKKAEMVLAAENRLTQALFFVWGVVILVLHLYAESLPGLSQCQMQCKPWGASQPSCSLLVLDCYEMGLDGYEHEVTTQWSPVNPTTTMRLVIRHCPRLEMPEMLTEFSQLRALKFYNSTIANWGADAAISEKKHPNLIMLYVVRVNMTDGELPPGLLSDDFPSSLIDIEFCITNLRKLPDDFDLKWPKFASIYFEASNLTEVPHSLVRLAPFDVSVAINPIADIPGALFDGGIQYLHIGSTLISELPKTATNSTSLFQLRMENTNISFFWDWIDTLIARVGKAVSHGQEDEPPISAYNSQYCLELERIFNGDQTRFVSPQQDDQSLILSDASRENWEILKKGISCEHRPNMWYPIDFEDVYSGIR